MPSPSWCASRPSRCSCSPPCCTCRPTGRRRSPPTGQNADESLTATLDWRQTGDQTWEIDIETVDGLNLKLSDGGARLEIAGEAPFVGPSDEYPDIYRDFAKLLAAGQSNVDASPFQLVADAFMLGSRTQVGAFEF